ncbi:CBS domain-containing protein, partial [Candidatus Micrarchaeota archaeon]|nr:CBS domain-containing protein [Candidatus Micrarchaeota archaeon]
MSLLGIASDQVYAVSPQDTLAHVRNVFVKRGVSHVLVYDTKVRGMVTDNDLANALLRERRSIDAIPVSQVMSKNVITVTPNDSPQEAARLMSEKHISGIPVVKGGDVLGIVTKTDLTRHFAENFTGFASVGELMSTTPKTIQEFQSIFHAANEMKRKHVKRLVVMRDKKPAGMVSERDLSLATFGLRPSRVVFSRTGRSGMPHR